MKLSANRYVEIISSEISFDRVARFIVSLLFYSLARRDGESEAFKQSEVVAFPATRKRKIVRLVDRFTALEHARRLRSLNQFFFSRRSLLYSFQRC